MLVVNLRPTTILSNELEAYRFQIDLSVGLQLAQQADFECLDEVTGQMCKDIPRTRFIEITVAYYF